MFVRLLFAIAILTAIFYGHARFRKLPPEQRKAWTLKFIAGVLIAVLLVGVVTGHMHWLGAVAAAILGFARYGVRLFGGLPALLQLIRQQPFGNPVFSTAYLRAEVDLKTNHISGKIVSGPHEGAPLESLTEAQLVELEAFYQDKDKRSYYLIKAFRQQRSGRQNQQQERQKQHTYASLSEPSYHEALQILGLDTYLHQPPPDKKTVVQAHRKLMQKLHPDRGGNDYLASRVNIAKEVVLKHIENP